MTDKNPTENRAADAQSASRSASDSPPSAIAVIGDSSLRTGFRLAGVTQMHRANTPAEAEAILNTLMNDETIGIIIIEERMLESIDWRLKKKVESVAKPVVVAVPGRNGPMEQTESIGKLVKRALGFDLMKKGKTGNGNGKNGNGKNGPGDATSPGGNGHGNGHSSIGNGSAKAPDGSSSATKS